MVASSAFGKLSEVLGRLESSGADVRHTTVDQDLTGRDEDVTAEVTVGLPPIADTSETVSIVAETATVDGGQVVVDLTVTVTTDIEAASGGGTPRAGTPVDADGGSDADVRPGTRAVPAYKDPEALRTVYDRYETFPEMTDALGVDVTSETVRRHMVKHDVHDPTDTTPTSYSGGTAHETRDDSGETIDVESERGSVASGADDSSEGGADASRSTGNRTSVHEDSSTSGEGQTRSAVTDGGSVTDGTGASSPAFRESSTVGESSTVDTPVRTDTPVREVIAGASVDGGDETSDSVLDLPETLTVAELADAIDRSRTTHELTQRIGVPRSSARRLLRRFDLVHFVSRSVAAEQVTVSPDVVVRRLTAASR